MFFVISKIFLTIRKKNRGFYKGKAVFSPITLSHNIPLVIIALYIFRAMEKRKKSRKFTFESSEILLTGPL